MTLAVGRLSDAGKSGELGTVFAVTDRLALTAFHCVGDRRTGEVRISRVRCTWDGHVSDAVVEDGDHLNDVALLRLSRALPGDLEPIRLMRNPIEHTRFVAPGAPAAVRGVFVFAVSGEITWPDGRFEDGTPAIQLACRESAAELSLQGLSGAPVLVGTPAHAVGVVRWNSPRDDRPDLAAGGSIFAAPAAAVLQRWPALDSTDADNAARLQTLVRRLANRDEARSEGQVRTDVGQLLLTDALGLREHDLTATEGRGGNRNPIVIAAGAAVFVIRNDLRAEGIAKSARHQLTRQLADHDQDAGRRWVGVVTDGAEWRVYRRIDAKLREVLTATVVVDPVNPKVDELLSWLEAVLATGEKIEPVPGEIVRKLGAGSPSYAVDAAELRAIYAKHRDLPTVKVKRALWAKLLTTASGTNFTDDDSLFIDHTLLVAMAEVIGHAVVGFQLENQAITAATIMSGELFARAQIGGVVEADFFDWVVHVPGGDRFIKDLTRRLTRFSWSHVEHDVMKVLYESIIPQQVRHRLGEYYTPDWLAEYIVDECVRDPLTQRALDASCGSGTFLFHAVRHYIAAAEAAGRAEPETVRDVCEHVIGFDVHPVAVTLARVTYLLAIGARRLQDENRPAFTVPVYLADSLRWGQETTLWSDDNLSVPTALDHPTFVTDAGFVTPSARFLKFPDRIVANAGHFDRLVAEFAELATNRQRGTAVPSLAMAFRWFKIVDDAERSMLTRTFMIMCALHDEERDHIWGYYVRNVARPVWLKRPENRVEVLIGNPPWLAYRYMTEPQKASFRTMSTERALWAGASHATNQDLSALFVARCIEQYLRPDGRFGYVMPWGTLTRGTYAGFRTGNYPVPAEPVNVAFDRPWDLHKIKPAFFPVPASVVFGRRQDNIGTASLNQVPELWSGRFDTRTASRVEASASISRTIGEPEPLRATSPYATRFSQGATVVPRVLFVVDQDYDGPLGIGAGRRAVQSRRSALEKKPWKDLPPLRGIVEKRFIRPLYLGDTVLPFRCLPPLQSVIPWDRQHLLDGHDHQIDQYPGLAKWWREAEEIWSRNRSSDRLELIERLDYHRGLSQQFPAAAHRIVYSASGMYVAAAVVSDPTAIIEHKLYWSPTVNHDEARFLTAILNATVLTMAVRPMQARGEHNPRDFDKYIFQLPIPLYDASDAAHKHLVAFAERAEQIAASVVLPAKRFETQRRRIREALIEDGVAADIDAIVKTLLA